MSRLLTDVLALVAFGFLYLLTARLTSTLGVVGANVVPIWPAAGLAMAATFLFGPRFAVAAGIAGFFHTWGAGASFAAALGVGFGNSIEAAFGWLCYRRVIVSASIFQHLRSSILYLLLCGGVATFLGALIGVSSLYFLDMMQSNTVPFYYLFLTWWGGDAVGVMLGASLLLSLVQHPLGKFSNEAIVERILILTFVVVLNLVIFGFLFKLPSDLLSAMMFLPLVVLQPVIFRWGPVGLMLALASTTAIAVTGTVYEHGPFSLSDTNTNLIVLMFYLTIVISVVLVCYALISERRQAVKQLEQVTESLMHRSAALQKNSEKLQRSNEELESFAYACSHDLKEPLRMIILYSDLLSRRLDKNAKTEASEYFGYIQEAAERMARLVGDLLLYSKVVKDANHYKRRNMITIREGIDEAIANLKVSLDEACGQVKIGEIVETNGERVRLVQILQNLIANSIKFRVKDRPLKIEIGSRIHANGKALYWIKDNGIGIPSIYHRLIFGMFKRLHHRQAYPGSGIGLALCKRIVESEGGEIWVESREGQGATFYFTMPMEIQAHFQKVSNL